MATGSDQKSWPILSPRGRGSCRLWCSRGQDANWFKEPILPKITFPKRPMTLFFLAGSTPQGGSEQAQGGNVLEKGSVAAQIQLQCLTLPRNRI